LGGADLNIFYGIFFAVYLLVLVGISWYASTRIKESADFLVAGRRLPYHLATATLFATWFCGGTIVGGAGTAYEFGFWNTSEAWGVIPDPYGAGLCLVLAGLFYMPLLRRMEGLTLADFFEVRYNQSTATLSGVTMGVTFLFWTAVQIIAFGKLFTVLLGFDYTLSILIAVGVMLIYILLGGLWAISLTDFWHMLLLIVGLVTILAFTIKLAGGWPQIRASVPAEYFRFFPDNSSFLSVLPWIAGWMIMGLGSISTPDLMQRALACKDERTARSSAISAGVLYWIIGSIPVLLGIIGISLVQQGVLDGAVLAEDYELLVPLIVKEFLPPILGALFSVAMLAAIMSSASAALLACSGIFVKNIYQDVFFKNADDKTLLKVTRIGVVAITVLATVIAFIFPYVFLLTNFSFDMILACLFIPLTLGLWWKKANAPGAISGCIAGGIFRVILPAILEGVSFESITYPANWYYYTILSPLVGAAVMIAVSLLSQKSHAPRVLHLEKTAG
jgi:SSS family solute:Na+ symporter